MVVGGVYHPKIFSLIGNDSLHSELFFVYNVSKN